MSKTTVAAAVLVSAAFLGPAHAAPLADKAACNALAFSLAEKAAAKKLVEAAAIKVDELIGKLEGQCGEGKLTEAEGTAKEVEAAIK